MLNLDLPTIGFYPMQSDGGEITDFEPLSGCLIPQDEVAPEDIEALLNNGQIVAKITDDNREEFFQVFEYVEDSQKAITKAFLQGIDEYYDCESEEIIYLNY